MVRLPKGCRFFFCLIVALFPSLSYSGSRAPVWSRGTISFVVDSRSFLEPEGKAMEEFLVKIMARSIVFKKTPAGPQGAVKFTLSFRDTLENEIEKKVEVVHLRSSSDRELPGAGGDQLVILYHALSDTTGERLKYIEVKVEDLNARKRGLIYFFVRHRKEGRARLEHLRKEFPPAVLAISDPQFCWDVKKAVTESRFEKSGLDAVPNPARTYGVLNKSLTVYYEVYDRAEGTKGGGKEKFYISELSILDAHGKKIQEKTDSLRTDLRYWVRAVGFDLSEVPAGTYALGIKVFSTEDGASSRSDGTFDIIWEEMSWEKSDESILDEASFLFSEKELGEFQSMGPGERESRLNQFWKAQDQTPTTARNETKEEFERRVKYANEKFGTFIKGMLTDRGRIYIKYGEPDEIRFELLPSQGSTVGDVLKEVARERDPEAKAEIPRDTRDIRPHEVWAYNLKGSELFSEKKLVSVSIGMVFVFVDEEGYGNYVLKYSTEHKKD